MRTIGKYEIRGLLGRGGMGAVYKVRHPELGRIMALKLLAPSDMLEAVVGADELVRRFTREARTMAAIRHPNVAAVWDLDSDEGGRPFFVMEYLCNNVGAAIGETYRVEDPSRVLSLDKAVRYASQALAGLARLHFAGIVHRDVKPFNLLLTGDDTVRIIDFGLSKLRGEAMNRHASERVGSPYYAAPEQEDDPEAATAEADIYAVGVMLHRMLTGRLPSLSCERPSRCNPDLTPDWDDFLDRCCAHDPARRPATAQAMAEELDRLHQAWRDNLDQACALPDTLQPGRTASVPELPLRAEPTKIPAKGARRALGLDELYRPLRYVANDFIDNNGGTVTDKATGLTWQQGGSPYPMDFDEAVAYVEALNAGGPDGVQWRLPTAPELMSILSPARQHTDFCMAPAFDTVQDRLWSADSRTFTSAWTADASLGFMAWHDFTCQNFVRAVCG